MTVPEQFALTYRRAGASIVVGLRGELDVFSAPQLQAGLTDLIDEQGNLSIVLDLRELAFIDSSGLAVLARGQQQARQKGGEIELAHPSPATRRLLEISGLTTVFDISGDGALVDTRDDGHRTSRDETT